MMVALLIFATMGTLVALAFWQPSMESRQPRVSHHRDTSGQLSLFDQDFDGVHPPPWLLAYAKSIDPARDVNAFARTCNNILSQVERIVRNDPETFVSRRPQGTGCPYFGQYTRRNGEQATGCAAMRQPHCLHEQYSFRPSHEACPVFIRVRELVQVKRNTARERGETSPAQHAGPDDAYKDGVIT